jgi:hypothetical protein
MLAPLQAHKARKRAQRRTRQVFFRALRLHWKSERLFRVRCMLLSYQLHLLHGVILLSGAVADLSVCFVCTTGMLCYYAC